MYICIEGGGWCIYVLKVGLVYTCVEGGAGVYMY